MASTVASSVSSAVSIQDHTSSADPLNMSSTESLLFEASVPNNATRKSSICSQALSSPRSPRHQRCGSFASSTGYSRRPSISSVVFSPRPYEPLFAERAYLSNSLEELSTKRLEMMGQYSTAAQELEEVCENAKQRRRLRKRLSLLRSKINQVVEQEKSLFLRLGELHLELESRDAWAMTQHHAPSSHSIGGSDTTSSQCSSSPMQGSMGISGPTTPLHATSPEFLPGQNSAEMQLGRASFPRSESASSSDVLKLATVEEAGEESSSNHGLGYEYKDGEYTITSEERPPLRRRTSFGSKETTPPQRRMSLPNLHSLWPEE
jgi:hypothetical protein